MAMRRSEAGLSLIEALSAAAVGALVLAALGSFYLSEQRAFRQQQIQIDTSQNLRIALEQMVRDLRAAGLNPTRAPGFGFTYADSSRVEFTVDANGNGIVDAGENKGFRFADGRLEIRSPSGGVSSWLPLADYVASGSFRYYDGSGPPPQEILPLPASAANLARIRRIDIVVRVENSAPGASRIARTEASSVRVRNLP
jgi:type IV pilus assembly protein PilW